MSSWANYKDKVVRYFPFSQSEWKGFATTVLVFAVLFSFTNWGETAFDLQEGLKNLLIAIVIVGVSLFVHHAAQRLMGLWYGYRVEHRVWWIGLLVGLLAAMLSNGRVLIFAATALQAHFLPAHRLGRWRYGPSLREIGATAFMGPIASVVVAFLLYLIAPTFFADFLTFNLLFAAYNMLPIPPLDGLHVFVGSRAGYGGSFAYLFTFFSFLGFFLIYFLANFSFWWSILLGMIIGLLGWFVFFTVAERK